MATFSNTPIGMFLSAVAQYILGDYQLLGVWLIVLFIGVALLFRLEFNLVLLLILPLTIVFAAYGLLYTPVAAVIFLLSAFILSANFIFNKR